MANSQQGHLDQPDIAWTFSTHAPIIGSPVVQNDIIFFGGLDSTVYAINLQNGKKIWQYKTGGEIRSTPCLALNKIFINCGDGYLYCFDAAGKVVWKFKTGGEKKYHLYAYADYYHSSPIYDEGKLYFGSGDSYIYAVAAANGNLLWKYKTGSVVHATGSTDHQHFYIGSFDGNLYALDKRKGTLKWRFKSVGQQYFPAGEMQGNTTTFNNRVFIGSRDYNLYAVDAQEGHGLWNKQFPKGWAMGSPVVQDSILYVGTSDDMVLLALNPLTGFTKWKADVKFNVFGGAAVTDSVIYVGTLMGKLFAIKKSTGKIKWVFETTNYQNKKTTYFKSDDTYREDIQTIITKGEDFLKMYYELGAIFSTPIFIKGYLLFTSTDGKLYCLKEK